MKIAICMTFKNRSVLLPYVLKSIALQQFASIDPIIIGVDGGSDDNSPKIFGEVLDILGIKYRLLVRPSNIPQGRNICLEEALKENPSAVIFIDSDMYITRNDVIDKLVSEHQRFPKSIICLESEQIQTTPDDLYTLKNLVPGSFGKALSIIWCGMGLTLLPAGLAKELRFKESMTQKEDIDYCYESLRKGYRVRVIKAMPPVAYDVNFGPQSDIYWSMTYSDYLRGLVRKSYLEIIRRYVAGSRLCTMLRVFKIGPSSPFMALTVLLYIFSIVAIILLPSQQTYLTIIVSLALTVFYIVKHLGAFKITSILKNYPKFMIAGTITTFLVIYFISFKWNSLVKFMKAYSPPLKNDAENCVS